MDPCNLSVERMTPGMAPELIPQKLSLSLSLSLALSQIYINNNGFLSFDGPLVNFDPGLLRPGTHRLIAPYLADVDTTHGGNVWFRETTFKKALK